VRPWQIEREIKYTIFGPGVSAIPRQTKPNVNNLGFQAFHISLTIDQPVSKRSTSAR
jgi:hypothetical protein